MHDLHELRVLEMQLIPGRRQAESITALAHPPVKGLYYRVPTVRGVWSGRRRWWPVRGRMHRDEEYFGLEVLHYHIDARFVDAKKWGIGVEGELKLLDMATRYVLHGVEKNGQASDFGLEGPVERTLRCVREEAPFRPTDMNGTRRRPGQIKGCRKMQAALAGRTCPRKGGLWICPHRGYPLESEPLAEEKGVVVCPMHGLVVRKGEVWTVEDPAEVE